MSRKEQRSGESWRSARSRVSIHLTVLVWMFALTATAVPASACSFRVQKIQALSFGEIVSPPDSATSAWVRLNLDGSYSLSSPNLSVNRSSAPSVDVHLGHSKVEVDDVPEGATVEIRVVALDPKLHILPSGYQRFQLFAGADAGSFDLYYGGELRIAKGDTGAFTSNIDVELRCVVDG